MFASFRFICRRWRSGKVLPAVCRNYYHFFSILCQFRSECVCVDVFSPATLTKCLIRREKFCLFFQCMFESVQSYTKFKLNWKTVIWKTCLHLSYTYPWTHYEKICMGCAWPKPIIKWTQYTKMFKFFFQQTTLFQLKTVIVFHVLSYLKRSSLCFQFAVYTYDQVITINND